MKLYLQFGHGMMGHASVLLNKWEHSGVILSPRDLNQDQLSRVAQSAHDAGARVLVDPQCYVREADHHRLVGHPHWNAMNSTTSTFLLGGGAGELLTAVDRMNEEVDADFSIIPGLLGTVIDADWLAFQSQLIQEAQRRMTRPRLATVAVGCTAMLNETWIEAIVEESASWDVDGFYVVAETPGPYLVDDPNWLANLLVLVSGLKLVGGTVVVGYSNHQGVALAAANADVIASGTWQNVRAFGPDKFFTPEEGDISRRAKWYYCPQALSEYKVAFLDIAYRLDQFAAMEPLAPLPTEYCAPLFSGAQPSGITWSERDSFRHYLDCLYSQTQDARRRTFDATVDAQHAVLNRAEQLLKRWGPMGIRGQGRDFGTLIDVNRAALAVLVHARGARLRRAW